MINESVINGATINLDAAGGGSTPGIGNLQGLWLAPKGYFGIERGIGNLQGLGFSAVGAFAGNAVNDNLDGLGFSFSASFLGAGSFAANAFVTSASFSGVGFNNLAMTGLVFVTKAAFTGFDIAQGTIKATGFSTAASFSSGGNLAGIFNAPKASFTGFNVGTANLQGLGFATIASFVGFKAPNGKFTGTSFATTAHFGDINTLHGLGFTIDALFTGVGGVFSPNQNDTAIVMNMATTETTRLTRMPFMAVLNVAGQTYLVRTDGLYRYDQDTAQDYNFQAPANPLDINGTILTGDSEYGTFRSKHLEYVYLDSDTPIDITPFHDGVQKITHTSRYKGRKTKMGKGNTSRFIQLRLERIKQLTGMEVLTDADQKPRQRRVK